MRFVLEFRKEENCIWLFQISPCLASLLLTGFASPFFHNGSLKCEDEDEERQGVSDRNFIGYLLWDRTLDRTMNQNIGSRLKTPHLPIWVTNVNHQWGVLFNPKLDLMKSHAAENRWVVKELCQTSCWIKFVKVFYVLLQWTSWEKRSAIPHQMSFTTTAKLSHRSLTVSSGRTFCQGQPPLQNLGLFKQHQRL